MIRKECIEDFSNLTEDTISIIISPIINNIIQEYIFFFP
jgi:hypothetical protein